VPASTFTATRVGFKFGGTGNGTVTISLRNSLDGTVLATTPSMTILTSGGFTEGNLNTAVTLTQGATYYLQGRKKLISKRKRRRGAQSSIRNKRSIEKRPKHINTKKRVGDMEGDFIASGKSGKGLLLVHTERKLRCVFLEKIFPVSIRTLKNGIGRIQKRFPEMKTVTWDNDILLICHQELEKQFGIKIYFCHTHSPWEKPLVENRNKLIRKYIPKGSDISKYSKRFIQVMAGANEIYSV
jgi:IS30 family transposase